jgi:hypothetical protein
VKQIKYPSAQAPGLCEFSIEIPDDWRSGPGPQVSMIAVGPDIEGRLRASVSVSQERVSSIDLAEVAAQSRSELEVRLAEFSSPGPDTLGEVGGFPAMMREFAHRPIGLNFAIYQAQLQVVVPVEGGLVDVLTATGTCSGSAANDIETIRAVVRSTRPEPAEKP